MKARVPTPTSKVCEAEGCDNEFHQRDDEPPCRFRKRRTCSKACGIKLRDAMMGRPKKAPPVPLDAAWGAGVRFDSADPGDGGTVRLVRPMEHSGCSCSLL
jgi:hypothetical protein